MNTIVTRSHLPWNKGKRVCADFVYLEQNTKERTQPSCLLE